MMPARRRWLDGLSVPVTYRAFLRRFLVVLFPAPAVFARAAFFALAPFLALVPFLLAVAAPAFFALAFFPALALAAAAFVALAPFLDLDLAAAGFLAPAFSVALAALALLALAFLTLGFLTLAVVSAGLSASSVLVAATALLASRDSVTSETIFALASSEAIGEVLSGGADGFLIASTGLMAASTGLAGSTLTPSAFHSRSACAS